ncbi:MAG: diacylglycerol kinase family protein [Ferruginibacter sp.]
MKRMYYSFRAAVNGIAYVARHETNFRIHLVFVLLVISGGCLFSISSMNWMMLILIDGISYSVQKFSIQPLKCLCNKVQPAQDPLIRIIKDVAAGAVLLSAIAAIVIGLIIFLPYCIMLFKSFFL